MFVIKATHQRIVQSRRGMYTSSSRKAQIRRGDSPGTQSDFEYLPRQRERSRPGKHVTYGGVRSSTLQLMFMFLHCWICFTREKVGFVVFFCCTLEREREGEA